MKAMKDPLSGIIRAIRNALELSPPELAADIAERGIVLTGGGALMTDLDKLISSFYWNSSNMRGRSIDMCCKRWRQSA